MKGSCLCGGVRFEARGKPLATSFCHCAQCRRMSGGFWASADMVRDNVAIHGEVRSFKASTKARRGVCPTCGSVLFWEAEGSGEIAVALGAVDGPTSLTVTRHLHIPESSARDDRPLRGACLCGAVTATLDADPGAITACHCTQCRKTSGHVSRSIDDPGRRSRIKGPVAGHRSPGGALRSFCPTCGTKLAFDGPDGRRSLKAGLFDALAAREPDLHVFAAWMGDCYGIPGGVPAWPEGGPS